MLLGICALPPATINTTMVSPTALPKPNSTLPIIPLFAAGITALKMLSILVAPNAREASLTLLGTLERASSLMLAIMGIIITPKIIEAEKTLSPVSR
jgi:hypothetical protein